MLDNSEASLETDGINVSFDPLCSQESDSIKGGPDGLVVGAIVGGTCITPLVLFEYEGVHFCREVLAVVGDIELPRDVGRQVCIAFIQSSLNHPIILGLIHRSSAVDSELTFSSSKGINLTCGKASISLRPDGTVAIRGVNIASRASHTNRIRGGNVQIN